MIKVPKTGSYVVQELNVGVGQPFLLKAEWILLGWAFMSEVPGFKLLVLMPVAAEKALLTEGADVTRQAAAAGPAS